MLASAIQFARSIPRSSLRWVVAGLFVLGFIVVALRAIQSPWYISATAIREFEDPQFDQWLLTHTPPPPKKPEHSPPYSVPDVTIGERDIWIQRRLIEPPRSHGGEVGAMMIDAVAGTAKLPGDLEIELVAAGMWVPGSDEVLQYFDPHTGAPVAEYPDLPPIASEFLEDEMLQPVLRLVFAGSGMRTWNGDLEAFDRRTQWPVVSDFEKRARPVRFADVQLKIWHDTPLKVMLEVPCGRPAVAPIPTKAGDQLLLDSGVRFQFIATGLGNVSEVGRRGETWEFSPADLRHVIGRVGPAVWAEQCHFRYQGSDESVWFPLAWFERKPRIQAARLPVSDAPVEIVSYPQRARVWFDVEALPFMPNPRSTRNLFEVKIPFVAPMEASMVYKIAADAVELESAILFGYEGRAVEAEHRNTTPTTLLKTVRGIYPKNRLLISNSTSVLVLEHQNNEWWDQWRDRITKIWPF